MKMFLSKSIFCSILVALSAVLDRLQASTVRTPFILRDKSFSIRSRISASQYYRHPLVVHEHYSIGERRARLDFDGSVFLYDAKTDASIRHFPEQKLCHNATLDSLYDRVFERERAPTLAALLSVAGRGQDLKYVIGPAKLLFLVAHEQANLKSVGYSPEDGTSESEDIRLYASIKYQLEVQLDTKKSILMTVFYDKLSHSLDSIGNDIPLQIALNLADDKTMIIDYFKYELTDDRVKSAKTVGPVELAQASDVILDLFTFTISMNCTKLISRTYPLSLFREFSAGNTRLSFEADIDWQREKLQYFVAFDGLMQFMRVDVKHKQFSPDYEKLNTFRILDYRYNRQYTILDDDYVNTTSQLLAHRKSNERCLVTYMNPPSDQKQQSGRQAKIFPLDELLFGADEFVLMGRAKVHGVEAQVYEAFAMKLPRWLTKPLIYETEQGRFGQRFPGFRVRQYEADGTIKSINLEMEFNVVVYLADDRFAGPKVLMIEIYDLKMPVLSPYRRSIVARLHNFVWELSDAPNGDSAKNLFTIVDRCVEGPKEDKHLEVDLLLEEIHGQGNGSRPEEQNWIKQWWLRDKALATGISETLGIRASMMYDLESKLVTTAKNYISVTFQVSDLPQKLNRIIFLGNAEVFGKTDLTRRFSTQTATDCLWAAENSEPVNYLIWSENPKACLVDGDLKGSQANVSHSKVFRLKHSGSSEVFKVERKYDADFNLAKTSLQSSKFQRVESSIMVLQNSRDVISVDRTPSGSSDVTTRIWQAKMKSFDLTVGSIGSDNKQVRPAPMLFSGLAFYELTSTHLNRAYDNYGVAIQSLQRCKAACLMDFNCKSYSFCASYPEPQCMLSYVSLEAPGTREFLNSREVQQKSRGSRFTLASLEGPEVELVRDFRCELRNKVFIDLFKPTWTMKVFLSGFQIMPTQSVEQCAEICMAKSIEAIKLGTSLTNQLNALMSKDGSASATDLEALRQQHRQAMAQFCDYFLYLDSTLDEKRRQLLMQRVNETSAGSEYCLIESPILANKTEYNNIKDSLLFEFSAFRFDYTNLYERVSNLRLVNSQLNTEELEAYRAVSESNEPTQGHYKLLQETLNQGKNFQTEMSGDSNRCGHLCFTQSSGLWPACRSFDVTVKAGQYISSTCKLNTGSLRNYLTETAYGYVNNTIKTQVWHYEPIFGQLSDLIDSEYALDYLGGPIRLPAPEGSSHFLLSSIVLVGLISGLALGVYASPWLESVLHHGGTDDNLVSGLIMNSVSNGEISVEKHQISTVNINYSGA